MTLEELNADDSNERYYYIEGPKVVSFNVNVGDSDGEIKHKREKAFFDRKHPGGAKAYLFGDQIRIRGTSEFDSTDCCYAAVQYFGRK